MKKLNYLLLLIVIFLSSCATYDIQTTTSDEAFTKVYCKNPEYIETKTIMLGDKNGRTKIDYIINSDGQKREFPVDEKVKSIDLTISRLTSYAQFKSGRDVTITNIRWDIETSTAFFFFTSVQKVGATYDVIKCK